MISLLSVCILKCPTSIDIWILGSVGRLIAGQIKCLCYWGALLEGVLCLSLSRLYDFDRTIYSNILYIM